MNQMIQINHDAAAERAATLISLEEMARERARIIMELQRIERGHQLRLNQTDERQVEVESPEK